MRKPSLFIGPDLVPGEDSRGRVPEGGCWVPMAVPGQRVIVLGLVSSFLAQRQYSRDLFVYLLPTHLCWYLGSGL